MPASSFAAVNIRVEMDPSSGSAPTWQSEAYYSVRHIPGSNEDVIQTTGRGYGTLSATLLLDPSEWAALSALLPGTGELVIGGVPYGVCLLEALGAPVRHHDGWITVQAAFRRTGA